MKQITIIGNLGANAVRRTMSEGRELMTFSVAVSAGQTTLWFNCVGAFREKIFPYLVKGQCVCVVGDIMASIYKGQSIDLTVNIDRTELCGKAPANEGQTQISSAAPVNNEDRQSSQSFDAANQPEL